MVDIASFQVFLETVGILAALIFVISNMLSMGFSLTVSQIIAPLRNTRLVVLALVANFILVPILAVVLVAIFPLPEGLAIGLILVGTAAGAPFLPRLARAAKGDMAFSVGLMVLLMGVTILYVPIVLPLLIRGVTVNPLDIARSLVLLLLFPLAVALVVRARYEEAALGLVPIASQAANLSLLALLVAFFVAYFGELGDVIGTTAILAAIIFLLGSFVFGYLLGGPGGATRRVLAVGTAQRNLSAAIAISALNFTDPDVLTMVLAVALAGLVLLMILGGELGKRAVAPTGGVPDQELPAGAEAR